MRLEKMDEFFDNRLDIYDEHQLNCIESAKEFYPFTASVLPMNPGSRVLDLGCGTGLELDEFFVLNPTAEVVGVDLAKGMLEELKKKHKDKNLKTINDSYFDVPFENGAYDAVVSVESLHHFSFEKKTKFYSKLRLSLKPSGYFILTDYFSPDDEAEKENFSAFENLKKKQGINDSEFYHYDTPLTLEHEICALQRAGFLKIELLGKWGATATLKAY